MIENYIMQALFIGIILIVSIRVMMVIYNTVARCRRDFAEVTELELLDPRPMRISRSIEEEPEEQADESASEAEVAADEDHINTV